MRLRSWCTEPLESHVVNVITLALGGRPREHRVFEVISSRLGAPKPSSDSRVERASKLIGRRFEASCKRLSSLTGVKPDLVRDVALVALALHDVGKCGSGLSSAFAKVDAARGRCRVDPKRVEKLLEEALEGVKRRRLAGASGEGAEKLERVAESIRAAFSRFEFFGCPLEGGVCPRALIFEVERNLDSVLPSPDPKGLAIARALLRTLHRGSPSLCGCRARPSLAGHEIPSAYAFYVLACEALRRLKVPAEPRHRLASLLAMSILLHHYASRNLDTAMDRLSGEYLPTILLDSGTVEGVRASLQAVERYLELRELADSLSAAFEKTMQRPVERRVYVPTFVETLLSGAKGLAKLYVVPLEPLCLADSLASYVGRGVGSPPSIVRMLL